MTRIEEIEEQNAAIAAVAAGICALVDELHEAGLIDREAMAFRLRRLRRDNGEPIPTIERLAERIRSGQFATVERPPLSLVGRDQAND